MVLSYRASLVLPPLQCVLSGWFVATGLALSSGSGVWC